MSTQTSAPGSALRPIHCGFMPLVDCAPLVVALEKGFAAAEGLDLSLHREASWATLRDRLVVKHFEAAHMLAPLPIASNLGLMALNAAMVAPLALGLGGNAITVSTALADRLDLATDATPYDVARAIGRVTRAAATKPAFAVTHPFSTHNYELRHFLASGGLDPDRDVRLVVVPPPYMADALSEGQIDGFCVGAPWSSLAVEAGTGVIIATKSEVFGPTPEKVLALRAETAAAEPETVRRLTRALTHALTWCADPAHHDELATLLAAPHFVNAPAATIHRCLTGDLIRRRGEAARPVADYLVFGDLGARVSLVDHGLWTYAQMIRWGHATLTDAGLDRVRSTFDGAKIASSVSAQKPLTVESYCGGQFDPNDIAGYLAAWTARMPAALTTGRADGDESRP